jgi:hypothetical protein
MKSIRKKILLGLLIIPVSMIIVSLFQTTLDPGLELTYLVFGVPICVLNVWEWFEPEIINRFFEKSK